MGRPSSAGCRRGCRPTPDPALPSMRGRRPSEICPVPFAAQSDPQALLRDIGGNRSVVSVDQRVLGDLLGRDGALEDSTKTLLTRSFTCLVAASGLMNMKTAPLWIALSISRSATRRNFSALCPKPPNFLPLCLWHGLHNHLAVAATARNKEAADLLVINHK